MTNRSLELNDRVYEYLLSSSLNEPELFRRLREETARLPEHIMQIAPEQGQFMALLVELLGAKRCIEIGTFTGYSALWLASALPEDGQLIACDLSEEWTQVAKRYWQEAGLSHKIDLRLGPALGTLDVLLQGGEEGTFDFAFIDADKTNYDGYYERCLRLLRPGGLIALDNTFWGGKVADPNVTDKDTEAIRAMTLKVRDDDRITSSLVPIGDGVLLVRKR